MRSQTNILLTDRHQRPIVTDIFLPAADEPRPVVIFAHGFNGFKDWGAFNLLAHQFVAAGFVFVKFNFSFNGTTPAHPTDFVDLPAFGENNYTKELDNLTAVIDWVCSAENPHTAAIDASRIGLLGHSLGGGMVLLQAGEDDRIIAVATWAAISESKTPWGSWPREQMAAWKQEGVMYIENGRTHQQMPLYYQLHEDYLKNEERLSIEAAVKRLKVPLLLCHGEADTSVLPQKALQIKSWQPAAELFLTAGDHVFGQKHPWPGTALPDDLQPVLQKTIVFFREALGGGSKWPESDE